MKKAIGIGIGLIGVVGTANAVVYIGDPSLDLYKEKTDQMFFDMYQNPQSALGGEVQSNPEAKKFFNSIPTGNRIAEGRYLDRVKQATIGGGQLPNGASAKIRIFGKEYRLVATANGIELYDMNGNLVKSIETLKLNNDWRLIPHQYRCGKSTCTAYTERQGTGIQAIPVPSTGNLYEYVVNLKQTRGYIRGRYTPWGKPQIVSVMNVEQKRYNLAKAILNGGVIINLDRDLIEQYKRQIAPIIIPIERKERHGWSLF